MFDQRSAQDDSESIPVSAEVVSELVTHMQESGSTMSPSDARFRLERGLRSGLARAKSFQDASGPGWIVDLSDSFDGEMLYAVIRSMGGGVRAAVAVVEADSVEGMQTRGEPLPGRTGDAPPAPREPSGSMAPRKPVSRPQAAPTVTESPDDPHLILVAEESEIRVSPIRVPRRDVSSAVQKLIKDGVEPSCIEIWSSLRRPRVQIVIE